MMKIGWLVWMDDDDQFPLLVPEGHSKLDYCHRKMRIVYMEAEE